MKVALASDLHLEFGMITLKNTEQADVLILSGDVCVAMRRFERFVPFFEQVASEFENVVYVFGNHEHYDGDFAKSHDIVYEHLTHIPNIYIMDKGYTKLGDFMFYGGTLWTDMNEEDTSTMKSISRIMNDFRVIENSTRGSVTYYVPTYKTGEDGVSKKVGETKKERVASFSPEDSVEDHKLMLSNLDKVLAEHPDEKFVVVGHHAPSKKSIHPRYADDFITNGAYSSDLTDFITNHPQIKLWTHGHTHHKFDYMIGDTRVVCNPRGYVNYEPQANDFELQYIDL
ncbi:MAG: hypothetical protein EBZ49_01010 [Proteobacteria bacterium]|nr:hypothetical protein [Pseudomonadota bacterium]